MDTSALRAWLTVVAVGAAAVVVPSPAAGTTAPPAVPARPFRAWIAAAAGTDAGLLAVTSSAVTVLDRSGKPLATLPAERGALVSPRGQRPGAAAVSPAPAQPGWPGLTPDADYSGAAYDPDDIDDGDDPRLADDALARPWEIDEAERRRRGTAVGSAGVALPAKAAADTALGVVAIAAAGDRGWVVRDEGIWRVELRSGAASRVHPPPRGPVRTLAAGVRRRLGGEEPVLAVVDGDDLLVSNGGGGVPPRFAGVAAGWRKVAVGPAGSVLGLERGGRLRAHHPTTGVAVRTVFPGGVEDVAGCEGGPALVLAGGSIFQVSGKDDDGEGDGPGGSGDPAKAPPPLSVVRVGRAPPGSERLACGARDAGLVAFGSSLHVSLDGGRTWRERRGPSTGPVRAVIPTGNALWVAVPSGLWPLRPATGAEGAPARELAPETRSAVGRGGATNLFPSPRPFWWRWAGWLPVVDLEFEVGRVGTTRDVRGLVCASFRLDGPWSSPPPRLRRRTRVAAERDAGVAELEALTTRAVDPIAVEERRALARILEEGP